MQRADLIDTLRDKIGQLEAAQAEITKKERLERELELTRQIKSAVRYPLIVIGVIFAAIALHEPCQHELSPHGTVAQNGAAVQSIQTRTIRPPPPLLNYSAGCSQGAEGDR